MSIIEPKIDVLLDQTDNDRFLLCALASKRAHDINDMMRGQRDRAIQLQTAVEIARAAESAGADAISLINTLMGMAIDADRRCTLTSRPFAGFSGPAIKPVALRCVWQCHNAVKVPLLGMGGISNGTDAVEFMLAGATAVAVGTANFVNPQATIDVIDGIAEYCERHGVKDVNELIGALQC